MSPHMWRASRSLIPFLPLMETSACRGVRLPLGSTISLCRCAPPPCSEGNDTRLPCGLRRRRTRLLAAVQTPASSHERYVSEGNAASMACPALDRTSRRDISRTWVRGLMWASALGEHLVIIVPSACACWSTTVIVGIGLPSPLFLAWYQHLTSVLLPHTLYPNWVCLMRRAWTPSRAPEKTPIIVLTRGFLPRKFLLSCRSVWRFDRYLSYRHGTALP